MDEGQLEHAEKVDGSLLKPPKDTAALFEPANELFDDASASIEIAVKGHGASRAIFVCLRRYYRLDLQLLQIGVDPVGPESFVARQRSRPGYGLAILIGNGLVSLREQFYECGRLVVLASRQSSLQGMTVPIAEQMDLCRKTPAGTA